MRRFTASVSHRGDDGALREEEFPVLASDRQEASNIALAYVLQILRLDEFELRIVGS